MNKRLWVMAVLCILLSGCDYLYARDEVQQMAQELSRLSGQNSSLVEELTRMETEMASLRDAVGLQGGAVLATSAVTDPLQQLVLADLPAQTALIPVNEEGTGLVYALSTAVFFGDNYVYVYAQGQRVGVDMVLSYRVQADGLNTVNWTAEMYNLGDGWIAIQEGTPVRTLTDEQIERLLEQARQEPQTVMPEIVSSSTESTAEESVSSSSSSEAGEGTSSSGVEASSASQDEQVSAEMPAIEADSPAESGMRDAYLNLLQQGRGGSSSSAASSSTTSVESQVVG